MFDIIVQLFSELNEFMHNGQNVIMNSVTRSWYWLATTRFVREYNTLINMQEDPTIDPDLVTAQENKAIQYLDILRWVFPQIAYTKGLKTPKELVAGFYNGSGQRKQEGEMDVYFLTQRTGCTEEEALAKIEESNAAKTDANEARIVVIEKMVADAIFAHDTEESDDKEVRILNGIEYVDEVSVSDAACKELLDQFIQSIEFCLDKDKGFFTSDKYLEAYGDRRVDMGSDLTHLKDLYPRLIETRDTHFKDESGTMEQIIGARRTEHMFQQDLTQRDFRDLTSSVRRTSPAKAPGYFTRLGQALFNAA